MPPLSKAGPARWRVPQPGAQPKCYAWGGLTVQSDLVLPRLTQVPDQEPDVAFRWRHDAPPEDLPASTEHRSFTGHDGRVIDVAIGGSQGLLRYQISDAGIFVIHPMAIDVYPHAGAEPMRIEHYLVNAILATYAGLQGMVCLHASAVAVNGRATVITGPSGVGKSTAAAELLSKGGQLISDDAVVVRQVQGMWMAFPGAATIRLLDPAQETPGWENRGKWESPMQTAPATPLEKIIVLTAGPDAGPPRRDDVALKIGSLAAVQPAWPWMNPKTRRRVHEQLTTLATQERVVIQMRPRS